MLRLFFRNAAFVGGAELILRLKGLIILPLLTHHLGAVSYGAWAQVSLIVTVGPILIMLGTDHGVTRYLPGRTAEQKKAWFSAWLIYGTLGAIAASLALVVFRDPVSLLFFGETGAYARLIPLAAASIFVVVLLSAMRRWFRLHHDGLTFSIIAVAEALFGIAVVIAVLLLDKGIYELVLYTLAGDALISVGLLALITRRYGWGRPDFSILPKALRFGLPLMPAALSMWALNWIDRVFLIEYTSLAEIGKYAVGYTLATVVMALLVRPFKFMYPAYSAELYNTGQIDEFQRLFNLSAGLTLVLCVPAVAGLWIIGPAVFAVLAPPSFASGAPVMSIVAAGLMFNLLATYYGRQAELRGGSYWTTVSTVIACAVNVALNFLLIPPYGIIGAAVATFFGFMARFLVSFCVSSWRYQMLKTNYRFVSAVIAATFLMTAALQPVQVSMEQDGTAPLLQASALAIAGAASYVLFLVVATRLMACPTYNVLRQEVSKRLSGRRSLTN